MNQINCLHLSVSMISQPNNSLQLLGSTSTLRISVFGARPMYSKIKLRKHLVTVARLPDALYKQCSFCCSHCLVICVGLQRLQQKRYINVLEWREHAKKKQETPKRVEQNEKQLLKWNLCCCFSLIKASVHCGLVNRMKMENKAT